MADLSVVAFELKWSKATDRKAIDFSGIANLLRGDNCLSQEQRKDLADILDALNKGKLSFSHESGFKKVRAKSDNSSPYTELKSDEYKYHNVCSYLSFWHEYFKALLIESENRFGSERKPNYDSYVKPFVAQKFKLYLVQNKKIFASRNNKTLDRLSLLDDVRKNYDEMNKLGKKYHFFDDFSEFFSSLSDEELKQECACLSNDRRNELD
ncbi:hypothetical protein OAP63_10460 [Vibrio sp.]|nr:hypothetical protein [Vibrio sp.]